MTRKSILFFWFAPFLGIAQNVVQPGVYVQPDIKAGSSIMISGTTLDLLKLEVSTNVLTPGESAKWQVGDAEEHLLLVQSESLTITLKDSTYSVGKGSVAMMMPLENYSLINKGDKPCRYHAMKYKTKLSIDDKEKSKTTGSFVKDWSKLTFKPHERGGVRPYFDRSTALTKRFEMHVTSLKEGLNSHDPHTHRPEEFILVLDGSVEMLIGEKSYKGKAGDIFFAPSSMLHGLKNDGAGMCSYFAFQWNN